MAIKPGVICANVFRLFFPAPYINRFKHPGIFRREAQAAQIKGIRFRQIADRSLHRFGAPLDSLTNPFQNPAVFAVTRPEKLSTRILSKPIYKIDPRQVASITALSERQPMRKVISHIVATEWKHRERITPQNTRLA